MVSDLVLRPIGVIKTRYKRKSEAPRQPGLSGESVRGRILLHAGRNFEQALKDLDGFERIWILSWFDRNANWKPLVLPPGSRKKHGVFATRSPYRPNPIGLSLCRLVSVKGRVISIENPDLLDGTPVLDIKPYIPHVEAFPHAGAGWVADQNERRDKPYEIRVEQAARDQITWLQENYGIDLETTIRSVLTDDPFPHPSRRIKAGPGEALTLSVRSWRIVYHVERRLVRVERVLSGYSAGVVSTSASSSLHDGPAHIAFHEHWPKQPH